MARTTYGQRAYTALQLLMGLRDPGIRDELAPFGMSEEVLEDGWRRLQRLTHLPRMTQSLDANIVHRLDVLENRWFPMGRYTLQYVFPEITEKLFEGLRMTSGLEVVISADLFVNRVDKMAAGEAPFHEGGPEAREALRKRGFTDEVLEEMRSLVAKVHEFKEEIHRVPEPQTRQAGSRASPCIRREALGSRG
jgi:hypothetical protein